MQGESWQARVAEIAETVEQVAARTQGHNEQRTYGGNVMTSAAPFRAGMVGAGNICEFHVAAVQRAPGRRAGRRSATSTRARAEEAAAKWRRPRPSTSLDALVDAGANVIHVLTPPSAHAKVAIEALERGCHVLIEKPIAESVEDARRIGELAAARNLVASVDHSLLYDPQVVRLLEQVRSGAIGDVVGVDIFRSSEYPPYEGGPLPPHLRDAGYPWRDVGVHCLYLIQELLGRIEDVEAEWCSLGGDPNLAFDEWRALVRCERGLGQFQLSWNAKPMQSQMIIHGTSGVLRADLFAMFLGKRSSTPLPKAAERVVNAYADSLQAAGRRAGRRVEVRAQGGTGVPGPARPRGRLLQPARGRASRRRSRSTRPPRSCTGSRRSPRAAEADHG